MIGKNLLWVAKQHDHSVSTLGDWASIGARTPIPAVRFGTGAAPGRRNSFSERGEVMVEREGLIFIPS